MVMTQANLQAGSGLEARTSSRVAAAAWLLAAVYYFYQYVMRSAPSVMMPQLSEAFGLSALGVASIIGMFYYGYSPFSLVAGAAMDSLGPRRVLPISAAVTCSMRFSTIIALMRSFRAVASSMLLEDSTVNFECRACNVGCFG